MNTRSFSFRLVAWYTCLLTGIFVLLCALLYLDLSRFLEHNVEQSQIRRADQIADSLLSQIQKNGPSYAAAQAEAWFQPEISDRFIRITQTSGPLIYASGAPKDGSFDPSEVPPFQPSSDAQSFHKVKLSNGKALIVAALNYKIAHGGTYIVESGTLLDPMELNHLILQLVIGLPLGVLIITAGGNILVRRALMPVERITRAAEQITQHNLSERLPVSRTGDELERLSISLNRMIARLDDAFQNSKRFVADASHELRTPLTILRGELETLIEDNRLEPEIRERAASMFEEAVRLTRIVEQLFTLSRLDAGEAQAEWSRFDLANLAKTTADQMSLLAEDKNITIACDADQSVEVEGDPARLKQVVVNLLDNAIKYTQPGGAVQLHVRRANGHAVLDVEDNGVGIPREALPHVFERFYRVDQIRSGDFEGAGLGLSIVKSICSAHGAEIEATSFPSRGSRFRVTLPLSKN
ncbi:MAG TPA: ATP-binding protein [Verrucomicrobiae bacterium]|nr:ATP-binding protein [Verrucomicrobiae bacterium]